ncbi:hypothetical protein D3C87_1476540 [compost metagenome]
MPDDALASLHAVGQRDRARVVAQHLHAAQFQRVFLRLHDPHGGFLAVMEQCRGGHGVGCLARGAGVIEADVGGHAQPHIWRGRFQRELDAVGAALRVGGGRDLAQDGGKSLAGQGSQGDAGALPHGQPRQHVFRHVADGVDIAGPGQLVDGRARGHVLARVGLFGGDHTGLIGF